MLKCVHPPIYREPETGVEGWAEKLGIRERPLGSAYGGGTYSIYASRSKLSNEAGWGLSPSFFQFLGQKELLRSLFLL